MHSRRWLLNCDIAAGRLFAAKHPAYVQEQILLGDSGVYSKEEWSRARELGYRGAGANSRELDSDGSYLQRMFSTHGRNLRAALRLADTVDLTAYRAVLELGCGEMIQAFVLTKIYPHLRYRATDFDPFIVEKCRRLRLLDHLEKTELDAVKVVQADIDGFDLVICWELFYALDDAGLSAVFRTVQQANASLLVCTSQLTGPLRAVWRGVKEILSRPGGSSRRQMAVRHQIRMHGWNVSIGHYARLAHPLGLRLARVWLPPPRGLATDGFSYLLFRPKT